MPTAEEVRGVLLDSKGEDSSTKFQAGQPERTQSPLNKQKKKQTIFLDAITNTFTLNTLYTLG